MLRNSIIIFAEMIWKNRVKSSIPSLSALSISVLKASLTFSLRDSSQLVYTIYGRSKVMSKIAELINLADKELYICTPMVKSLSLSQKYSV